MPPVGFEATYATVNDGEQTLSYFVPGTGEAQLDDGKSVVFPAHPSRVEEISRVVKVTSRKMGFTVLIRPGTMESISPDSPSERIVVGKGGHYDLQNFKTIWGSIAKLRIKDLPKEKNAR